MNDEQQIEKTKDELVRFFDVLTMVLDEVEKQVKDVGNDIDETRLAPARALLGLARKLYVGLEWCADENHKRYPLSGGKPMSPVVQRNLNAQVTGLVKQTN